MYDASIERKLFEYNEYCNHFSLDRGLFGEKGDLVKPVRQIRGKICGSGRFTICNAAVASFVRCYCDLYVRYVHILMKPLTYISSTSDRGKIVQFVFKIL